MVASGVLASFPYRCVAPAYGATGFLIASRLRLTGCRIRTVWWDGMWTPYLVEATLWSPGGPVALRLVHTLAPFPAYWREWSAALAAVGRSVRASGDSHMLIVGDFNATWGNSGFVALLHDGSVRRPLTGVGRIRIQNGCRTAVTPGYTPRRLKLRLRRSMSASASTTSARPLTSTLHHAWVCSL